MTNIAKQISEWDIKDIEKRLIEIQAAADGDCYFSPGNGIEILAVAQRTVELVRLLEGVIKGFVLSFEPLIEDVEKTARDSFATSSETFENDFSIEDPNGFIAWKTAKNKLWVIKNTYKLWSVENAPS